jgi:MoxR-like ATPase
MDDKVKDYILNIIFASRFPDKFGLTELKPFISSGGSPRATLSLTKASRANAFIRHRGFVTPEDVKSVAYDILRHRILLTYEAEAENITSETIVRKILDRIEVP